MDQAPKDANLSRRERQLLEGLYRLGRATAGELREAITNPPTYTAVRTHLSNLVAKGYAKVESDGVRYIYEPAIDREEMAGTALENVLKTFFDNRLELIVSTLLRRKDLTLDKDQLDRLAEMIDEARKEGR